MKASKCFWVALCLLVGSFSTELWAQKNLEAASCYKMPYNYIYAASCDEDSIRVSVGIEDIKDLIEDFEQAINKMNASSYNS